MKNLMAVLVAALISVFAVSYVNAVEKKQAKEQVLAEINGAKITLAEFNNEIGSMPANYRRYINMNKKKFLDDMIVRKLLYKEAVKEGLDKDKDVLDTLEKLKTRVMVRRVIEKVIESISVSDDDVKNYYEKHKKEFAVPEQVDAAHILIKVKDFSNKNEDKAALKKAKDMLKKIKAGEDFTELAKKYSDGPSKRKGGDLGYFYRGQMVPEFEKAAFGLKVGQVSGIVKTKFGYHIIKVLGKKKASQKGLKDVKEMLKKKLISEKKRTAVLDYTKALKEKAKITINEELLK